MNPLSILDAARDSPRQAAVVRGMSSISFAELAERTRARMEAVAELAAPCDSPGRRGLVALRTDEDLPTLELLLACFELGLTVFPIHSRLTPPEREQLIERAPVYAVVTAAEESRVQIEWREPRPDPLAATLLAREPQLAAIATSGTTGPARLALLSRRAFAASAQASARRLGWFADDRWLLALPVAHIGGLSVLTRCLMARRPVVVQGWAAGDSSVRRLARAIEDGGPTLLSLVPTQVASLLELDDFRLPERVRVILTGGAAASARLLQACSQRAWPLVTSYGLTEACSQVATQRPARGGSLDAGVGPPLEGVRVELHQGVIHVYGPTLMSGYIGPDAVACEPETGFRTRDLGRIDAAGCLHVLGRIDGAIVSGGENVAPSEVEAVLEACPGVLEACVFGVPDPHWGEIVAAALRVREADPTVCEAIIDVACRQSERTLAPFKRPRLYTCALELARGLSGKLDRRASAALLTASLRAPARR